MRTTFNIDEDVLQTAKERAALRRASTGRVLSELARKGLRTSSQAPAVRNGVPLLPERPSEGPVTLEIVKRLLDEE